MDDNPLTHLADIELPPPPQWHEAVALAAVAALVLLAAAAGVMWLRRRAARRRRPGPHGALRRLDQLMGQWQLGFVDDREAGYRLVALLRLALGLPQLGDDCPAPLARHRAEWRTTVTLLRSLRYERVPAAALTVADFRRIRGWIASCVRPAPGERRA